MKLNPVIGPPKAQGAPGGRVSSVSQGVSPQSLALLRLLLRIWSRQWAGVGTAVALAGLAGLMVARVAPRGPATAMQGLGVLLMALAVGFLAGLVMRSRWALLAAPVAHVAALELGRFGTRGLTVEGIHLDTFYGVLAFLIGRGFYALVALLPMLVGAAYGAGLARRITRRQARSGGFGNRLGHYTRRAGVVIGTVTVVALAVGMALPASTPPVLGEDGTPLPGSISSLEAVPIGGHAQWLLIRGARVDNPVLLYLAGGPGQSNLPIARVVLGELEREFVVVSWDQRGTGKSYSALDPASTHTLDQAVADTIELTNLLRERFHQQKIYLLGESWGTILGVLAVQRAPQLYFGYLGSGQMVNVRETDQRLYRDVLDLAEQTGDVGLARQMRAYGPPPYSDPLASAVVFQQYERLYKPYTPPQSYQDLGARYAWQTGPWGLLGSEYNFVEKTNVLRGLADTFAVMYPQIQGIDFRRDAPRLEVPVYLFDGQAELSARRDLALEWYGGLQAPIKRLYSFEDSAHAPAFEHFVDLHRIMNEVVLPETYPAR